LFHQIKKLTIKLKRLNYPVEIKRWTKEGEESTTTAVFAAQTSFDYFIYNQTYHDNSRY
jgi:hypothetical protein